MNVFLLLTLGILYVCLSVFLSASPLLRGYCRWHTQTWPCSWVRAVLWLSADHAELARQTEGLRGVRPRVSQSSPASLHRCELFSSVDEAWFREATRLGVWNWIELTHLHCLSLKLITKRGHRRSVSFLSEVPGQEHE